jgi:hypothetical protein
MLKPEEAVDASALEFTAAGASPIITSGKNIVDIPEKIRPVVRTPGLRSL